MGNRPKSEAVYYPSGYTVVTENNTHNIKRDVDGDYLIEDTGAETTIYFGNAQQARKIQHALEALLDANDEE